MKQVQEALKHIGIPVMAGVWRATTANQNPPVQYVVYLNLWSDMDPTETVNRIRQAIYAAGFSIVEESDRGYNQPEYDTATRQYAVQWTWCLRTEVPHAP